MTTLKNHDFWFNYRVPFKILQEFLEGFFLRVAISTMIVVFLDFKNLISRPGFDSFNNFEIFFSWFVGSINYEFK
jgi:hypothetical protein